MGVRPWDEASVGHVLPAGPLIPPMAMETAPRCLVMRRVAGEAQWPGSTSHGRKPHEAAQRDQNLKNSAQFSPLKKAAIAVKTAMAPNKINVETVTGTCSFGNHRALSQGGLQGK